MTGYDPNFLSVRLPFPAATGREQIRRLDYTHFSIDLDPFRRLAITTGVNIDGPSPNTPWNC